jgi:hypothetical protein
LPVKVTVVSTAIDPTDLVAGVKVTPVADGVTDTA